MKTSERKLFGLRLGALRAELDCRQTDVAKWIKKRQDYVSKVERGELTLSLEHIETIVGKFAKIGSRPKSEIDRPIDMAFWTADPGDDAHPLLHAASATYRAVLELEQMRGDSSVFDAARQTDYHLLRTRYSTFDNGLENLQQTIETYLERQLGPARVIHTETFSPQYDAIRWTSLATAGRAAYGFPFLLTPRRVFDWFVLPYGWHRRVGIIFNSDNPLLKSLTANSVSDPEASTLFGRVLRSVVNAESAHLYALEGWIQQELLQLWAARVADDRTKEDLPARLTSLFKDHLNLETNLPNDSLGPHDIYVFDLADRELVEAACNANPAIRFVEFEHGVKVPTGVGFTISMAPTVLSPHRLENGQSTFMRPWRHLMEALRSEVFLEPYKEHLTKIGIDLDLDWLPVLKTQKKKKTNAKTH